MGSGSPGEGTVRLRDGRRLGYSESGAPGGVPVLYFHGAAGSPVRRCHATEALLAAAGVRWIAVQRPGFGRSCALPGRRMADWAGDVEELADALELEPVSLLGVSAGAPYAIAAAAGLGRRVERMALVSSMCCPGWQPRSPRLRLRAAGVLARHQPGTLDALCEVAVRRLRAHPVAIARFADRSAREVPGARAELIAAFLASTERGARPIVDDLRLVLSPWALDLSAVGCDAAVWHGGRDRLVPVEHARRVAAALPGGSLTVLEDEGHFFFRRRIGEVRAALVGADVHAPVLASA